MDFHQGRISLIAKAKVQGQGVVDAPFILKVSAKNIGTLSPGARSAAAGQDVGKPQKEVGFSGPGASAPDGEGGGACRKVGDEEDISGWTVTTTRKGVYPLSPKLEAGMQDMPPLGHGHTVG